MKPKSKAGDFTPTSARCYLTPQIPKYFSTSHSAQKAQLDPDPMVTMCLLQRVALDA